MKAISSKTVVTYSYDDEREKERHMKIMKHDGWSASHAALHQFLRNNNLIVEYHKNNREGAFL